MENDYRLGSAKASRFGVASRYVEAKSRLLTRRSLETNVVNQSLKAFEQ
jgi:hypothetical protein